MGVGTKTGTSGNASGRLDLDAFREPRWPIEHVPPALRAEMDRLAARVAALEGGIRRLDAAVDRHRWAIERGHDHEPELGDQSARALRDLVALLDDRTETT